MKYQTILFVAYFSRKYFTETYFSVLISCCWEQPFFSVFTVHVNICLSTALMGQFQTIRPAVKYLFKSQEHYWNMTDSMKAGEAALLRLYING